MKKPIIQEHVAGCAVACVAFVLNLSYQKALPLFTKGKYRTGIRGFYAREVATALNRHGKHYSYHYIDKRNLGRIYKEGSIVFIGRNKKYPLGHYLCRKGSFWMNSWYNFPEIKNVKARFQKRLPGRPIYVIRPVL
jgi:hypothetical protein